MEGTLTTSFGPARIATGSKDQRETLILFNVFKDSRNDGGPGYLGNKLSEAVAFSRKRRLPSFHGFSMHAALPS